MAQSELVAVKREETGSGPAGRLRRKGFVPVVVYSHGKVGEKLAIERRLVDQVLDAGSHVVDLRDADGNVRRAVIREVQVQPVSQEVLHVDFQEVAEHEMIEISLRVVLRGEPVGVKDGGGVLDVHVHEIQIACPADAVADELRVDVSGLELGAALHVEELTLPEGATAVSPGGMVVASVRRPREVVEEEVPAAETEVPAQPEVIGEAEREERAKEKGE
ncbi:MAG: 50S ribosomal protein L25 [Planctomycetota bacterium]|jgi:large subunit ribosomal protein L25